MIHVMNDMPKGISTIKEGLEKAMNGGAQEFRFVTPMMTVPVLSERIENRRKRIKANVRLNDDQMAILKAAAELSKDGVVYVTFDSYFDECLLHGIEQLEISEKKDDYIVTYCQFKMWSALTDSDGRGVAELLGMDVDAIEATLTICKAYENKNGKLQETKFIGIL